MKVTGIIIRRKSFGKCLAFATLKVLTIEEENYDGADGDDDDDDIIIKEENGINSSDSDSSTNCVQQLSTSIDQMNDVNISCSPSSLSSSPLSKLSSSSSSPPTCNGLENEIINNEKIQTLRIVFQRDSNIWDKEKDDTFPVKNSSIPYGAKIKVSIQERHSDSKSACKQAVRTWEMIDDPRLVALENSKMGRLRNNGTRNCNGNGTVNSNSNSTIDDTNELDNDKNKDATDSKHKDDNNQEEEEEEEEEEKYDQQQQIQIQQGEEEGVLLHEYLKNRANYYLKYKTHGNVDKVKIKKEKNTTQEMNNHTTLEGESSSSSPSSSLLIHGDKKAKSLRAKIFASWLINEFGSDLLKQHNGVLDIAGGKGQVSVELSVLAAIQCTIIDPFIRGRPNDTNNDNNNNSNDNANVNRKVLSNKEIKRIKKVDGSKLPSFVAKYFMNNEISNTYVQGCSCVVGMHPDQPTEDIVDVALLNNKPFAIVPCCVFMYLFPMRRLKDSGMAVHTYDDFIQYLLEKDDRLQTTTLNFEGKNRVIYFKG